MTAATSRHLLLTADAVGGIWSYVVELAQGLQRRDVAVTIATLGPRPSSRQCEAVGAALVHTDRPLDWTAETVTALRDAARELAAIARSIQADSIHLHAPAYAGFADWPAPVVAVVHSCVATWWNAVRGGALPADLAWRAEAVARGLASAHAVIAPSHAFAAMLRNIYGDRWPLRVVHNGRSLPRSRPQLPRGQHVFTAGRLWDEGKAARTLDAAAGIGGLAIRAAGPVVGPNGTALRSRNLHLLGILDAAAMAHELAGAAVFASAARYEPFGLAVLEAAHAGLPLVLSDIPTFRELWNGVAQFVPCGDASGVRRGAKRRAARPDDGRGAGPCRPPAGRVVRQRGNGGGHACDARGRRARTVPGCGMNITYFTHSLASCWNHGNAHFVRGVLGALIAQGHRVRSFEPIDGWSRTNLLADQGERSLAAFASAYPELAPHAQLVGPDLDEMLDGSDIVIVHEWTEPSLIAAIGARRRRGARFTLLFHDTHHRTVSNPEAMRRLDLDGYDGVLAFGSALAEIYRDAGWGERAFVWHEAADDRLFQPPAVEADRAGVVWIGNWGDEERSEELHRYLLRPVASLGLGLDVYGVRYPQVGINAIKAAGGRYHGWIANADVPAIFAQHRMTVHVPRRFYVGRLPGIPTIRVFEALACGIPLVCAPWHDWEGLFRPGTDFLLAADPAQMAAHLRALDADQELRANLAAHGRETIMARHTCAHRARELLDIAARIGQSTRVEIA